MKKIMIVRVWMIFGSKLLSSRLMLAIYSFLKHLRWRQKQKTVATFTHFTLNSYRIRVGLGIPQIIQARP